MVPGTDKVKFSMASEWVIGTHSDFLPITGQNVTIVDVTFSTFQFLSTKKKGKDQ